MGRGVGVSELAAGGGEGGSGIGVWELGGTTVEGEAGVVDGLVKMMFLPAGTSLAWGIGKGRRA